MLPNRHKIDVEKISPPVSSSIGSARTARSQFWPALQHVNVFLTRCRGRHARATLAPIYGWDGICSPGLRAHVNHGIRLLPHSTSFHPCVAPKQMKPFAKLWLKSWETFQAYLVVCCTCGNYRECVWSGRHWLLIMIPWSYCVAWPSIHRLKMA